MQQEQQQCGVGGVGGGGRGGDTLSSALLETDDAAVSAASRFSAHPARQTRLTPSRRDVDELHLTCDEHVEEAGSPSPVSPHQDTVDDDCLTGLLVSAAEYSVRPSTLSELDRITQQEDISGLDSAEWNQLQSIVDSSENSTATNVDRNSDDLDRLESCAGNSNDEDDNNNDVDDSTLKLNNNNERLLAEPAAAIDSPIFTDVKQQQQQQQQQHFVRQSFARHSTNSFPSNRPCPAALPVPSAPVASSGNAHRPTDNVDSSQPVGAFVRGSCVRSSLPAHPGTPGIASRQPTSLAAAVGRGAAGCRIVHRPRTNTSSQTVIQTSDGLLGNLSCDVIALDDTGNMSTRSSNCHGDVGAAGGASRLLRRLVSPHPLQSPSRKQQQQQEQQLNHTASPAAAAAAAVSCCNTELLTGERLSNYSKVEQPTVDPRQQQQQQQHHQLVGRRRSANTPAVRIEQSPSAHQLSNVRHRSQQAAAAAGAVNHDRYNAAGAVNSRGCIRLPSPPTNTTAVAGGSHSDNSLIITNRSASLTTQNSVSDGHQYANVAAVLPNKNVVGNDVIATPVRPRLLSSASASRMGFVENVVQSPASSVFPVQHSISPCDVKPSRCIPLLGPVLRSPVRATTGLLTPAHSSSVLLSQSKSPFNSSPEDNGLHGSLLSLGSNSSSAAGCLSAEELQAQEVLKLRQELFAAQNKIISLSNHLSTNAQVVFAFEQSLTNMTVRLQRLATNTNQKDVELNELRATIESLRQQSKEKFSLYNQRSQCSSASNLQPLSLLDRQTSFDSINSEASTISQHSCTVSDKKAKKHKNWLSSVSKALHWRKKRLGTATDVESETSSLYTDPSFTLSVPDQLHASSVPSSPIRTSISSSSSSALTNDMEILQRQLHEKDMRLTDVQLEALTSAHRLQQMHDAMNRMKSEITSLRGDNERLHHIISQKGINVSTTVGSAAVQCSPHSQRSTSVQCISLADQSASLDFLLADGASSRNCQTLKLVVQLKSRDASSNPQNLSSRVTSSKSPSDIQIGELGIDSKTDWDKLRQIVARNFQSYLLRLEPETGLGLNEDSIQCFQTGEVKYGKGMLRPELLPCGYLVGDTNSILITLHGAETQCVDSLAFEALIPKPIVQRYISLLADHRRLILCGSSGTGKTYLAHKLAEHLVLRCGKQANDISVFNIDSQSGRELRQYLTSIAERCEQQLCDLPAVVILDNLHHITSPLGDIFNCLINVDLQTSPYIIGTMNQSTSSSTNLQLHHNFRWILCANHMEPVNGFLGRYLRRRLAATDVNGAPSGETMERIVEWIPRVWQHLNRLLETHNSNDVTIGPKLFLSCPMEVSEVPTWFIDLWNYSLVPYMLEAIREGVQTFGARASWEDPTDWIISTCPWTERAAIDLSGLLRIRPEDVGCEAVTATTNSCSTRSNTVLDIHDPLMNMLLRLQDAANYPSTSTSSELDTSIE